VCARKDLMVMFFTKYCWVAVDLNTTVVWKDSEHNWIVCLQILYFFVSAAFGRNKNDWLVGWLIDWFNLVVWLQCRSWRMSVHMKCQRTGGHSRLQNSSSQRSLPKTSKLYVSFLLIFANYIHCFVENEVAYSACGQYIVRNYYE